MAAAKRPEGDYVIYEFNHYGIVIRNLQKSLDFYQGLLGAKEVFRGFIPSSKTDVVYLQIAGGLIELLHRADPPADEHFGTTHIAFLTDDVDADYARVTGAGYKSLVAPRPAGSGHGRLCFVSDPNGARVELIQREGKMRVDTIEHPVIRAFDHYSLTANDLTAARKFYQDVFGMKTLKELPIPASQVDMIYLNYDYDVLELLHRPTPMTTDTIYGHFALRVDNVEEALRYFAERGVAADPGTPRRAGTGLGLVATIRDPDNVKIELLDRADLRAL
jgi:catechol 2,3-dioxygenase-like lactoylglutathione lyase family enzyme